MMKQQKNDMDLKKEKVDELKRFVISVQEKYDKGEVFKPERLQHMREEKKKLQKYNSGLRN